MVDEEGEETGREETATTRAGEEGTLLVPVGARDQCRAASARVVGAPCVVVAGQLGLVEPCVTVATAELLVRLPAARIETVLIGLGIELGSLEELTPANQSYPSVLAESGFGDIAFAKKGSELINLNYM